MLVGDFQPVAGLLEELLDRIEGDGAVAREILLPFERDDGPAAPDGLARAQYDRPVAALAIDLDEADVLKPQGIQRDRADGVDAGAVRREGQRAGVADLLEGVVEPLRGVELQLLLLGVAKESSVTSE